MRTKLYNQEILMEGAKAMLHNNWTLLKIESEMHIPHTSLHRFITIYLSYIDYDMHLKCLNMLKAHKHLHSGYRRKSV